MAKVGPRPKDNGMRARDEPLKFDPLSSKNDMSRIYRIKVLFQQMGIT
jgi:hypothetical protein